MNSYFKMQIPILWQNECFVYNVPVGIDPILSKQHLYLAALGYAMARASGLSEMEACNNGEKMAFEAYYHGITYGEDTQTMPHTRGKRRIPGA